MNHQIGFTTWNQYIDPHVAAGLYRAQRYERASFFFFFFTLVQRNKVPAP